MLTLLVHPHYRKRVPRQGARRPPDIRYTVTLTVDLLIAEPHNKARLPQRPRQGRCLYRRNSTMHTTNDVLCGGG